MPKVLCYNKGCGKNFDPEDNRADACSYHPGEPVFHDALKGWCCCKKRYRDFTDFLNIPGCTKGFHSNRKPVVPEKPKCEQNYKDEVIVVGGPAQVKQVMERPPVDEPMITLKVSILSSLKQALEKQMQQLSIQQNIEGTDLQVIAVGTLCKNKGCKKSYNGKHSDEETCLYHSGDAVFHEGYKYWSCCPKRTTDFTAFLEQQGCTSGKHLWVQPVTNEKKCRYDWHQTGSWVTISIYTKLAVPEKSHVKVNKVACNINIVFEGGKSSFEQAMILAGVVDPERSEVKMSGTKVEIILKKAELFSWSLLELPQKPVPTDPIDSDEEFDLLD